LGHASPRGEWKTFSGSSKKELRVVGIGHDPQRYSNAPGNIEPEACAELFLQHRAASLNEEVQSGVTFCEAY
jgi:hypothetical protein